MLRQRPSSGGPTPRSSKVVATGHSTPASPCCESDFHRKHSPYHHPHVSSTRPDWMSLQDIPDECQDAEDVNNADVSQTGKIWDGNKKLFVQLLDDMDNIGGVPGVSEGSARRRKKARELFSDWLFNRKTPEVKTPTSEFKKFDSRRFSGDFTDFDIRSPIGGPIPPGRPLPGRLERQAPSRRSCGLIGEVQRRSILQQPKGRPVSINLSSNEPDEADSGYHSGNSAVLGAACKKQQGPGELTLTRDDLRRRIEKFNANNMHGLLMEPPSERTTTFQGFIRVHMNLIRPISIRVSTKPLTLYDTLTRKRRKDKEKMADLHAASRPGGVEGSPSGVVAPTGDESMMSFRLPKNTSKVIHINSITSTAEVINVLLSKFNISDSPRKFSLYEKTELPNSKPTMRRMSDDERPLVMCLSWADTGIENLDYNKFVLQENDSGEIMWEAFSLPELESFLNVLNKEEGECIRQVEEKYHQLKIHMGRRMSELKTVAEQQQAQKPGARPKKRVQVFV